MGVILPTLREETCADVIDQTIDISLQDVNVDLQVDSPSDSEIEKTSDS